MKRAECDCCGASSSIEDVGTACRACGGRGAIVEIADSWKRPEAEVKEYIKQLNLNWGGDEEE